MEASVWGHAERRRFRPQGRGPVAALVALFAARPTADCRRNVRGEGPHEDARLATRPVAHTAERLSDCPLSSNGIAKGYIVERACDAAMASTRRA